MGTPDAKGQRNILGHYWDARQDRMRVFPGGEKQFCYRDDLFTLRGHPLGADALERVFFKEIDDAGADAHRRLLSEGVGSLSNEERRAFIRLMLSMDARRPGNVDRLVSEGTKHFTNGLDGDAKILAEFERLGVILKPSEYFEQALVRSLADQAMLLLQSLTVIPEAGEKLFSFKWSIRRLGDGEGTFVMSDRPLMRIHGIDHPSTLWAMPLSPSAMPFASPRDDTHENIARQSARRVSQHDEQRRCDAVGSLRLQCGQGGRLVGTAAQNEAGQRALS